MIDSPRYKKLLRDFRTAKGRMLIMMLAIAVGIFGVGTILSTYTILSREMNLNYMNTNPATAILELDKVDDSLVDAVQRFPGITDAEATSWVMSRIEINPNEWKPLLLIVVKDFNAMRINTFKSESGAWPPPQESILMERSTIPFINAEVGDQISIQTPNGPKRDIAVSGIVHDPSLAPSWQEQTAYGYVTPSSLAWLNGDDTLHMLKIIVNERSQDDRTISELAEWLNQQGHTVEEIRIPPAGKHPHQSQMTAILIMFLIFCLMALILSAILTATMIGGLLAGQIRQIGVMKAIGARTHQITGLYLLLVVLVGVAAVIVGLPLGIVTGQRFAVEVAQLLNFTVFSKTLPVWVYIVLLTAGILVPVSAALVPILKTTQTTVREAINNFGANRKPFGSRRLDSWLGHLRVLDRTLILALRNTFRRRGRLLLTLALLAAAGGMFITSLNVKTGWEQLLSDAASKRHYDLEIHLNHPMPEQRFLTILGNIPGVKHVESWNMTAATADRPDGLNIVRTYPDGGHGSFSIRSAPVESELVDYSILEGRLLRQGDPNNSVVLNHTAQDLLPTVKVGTPLLLMVDGHPVRLQVVGIVRENLSRAAAYISPKAFADITGQSGQTNAVRVVLNEQDNESQISVIKEIERILEKENASLKTVTTEAMLDEAVNGHVYILIFALIMMALLMAIVGSLGLMSTMGTNVVERTREFGIMRTVGGKSGTILRNVISEGIFIGLMSWAIAIIISIPLSASVGNLIGELAFRSPLPLIVSPMAIIIWLVVIIIGSIAASSYPARNASRLTIRDTLDSI